MDITKLKRIFDFLEAKEKCVLNKNEHEHEDEYDYCI